MKNKSDSIYDNNEILEIINDLLDKNKYHKCIRMAK